jgi:hypothetical protein
MMRRSVARKRCDVADVWRRRRLLGRGIATWSGAASAKDRQRHVLRLVLESVHTRVKRSTRRVMTKWVR